jgi:glutaminase
MYDGAGEWLVEVGLPAKSGVSGGVLAVLPARLGIAVFSPPVDAQGNSVRGIAVCRDVSRELALHLVRPGERPAPSLRMAYTVAERGSKRVRGDAERRAIAAGGAATAVFELQGELGFTAGEALTRELEQREPTPDLVVLDLRRVLRLDVGGMRVLTAIGAELAARGGRLALSGADVLDEDPSVGPSPPHTLRFAYLDLALEWCEDELLRRLGAAVSATRIEVADHQLLAGLSPEELEEVMAELGVVIAEAGTFVVRRGEPASEVYLVIRGTLSVVAGEGAVVDRRLTTVSAGMTFGEIAYVSRGVRTADVRADSNVECRTLPFGIIDGFRETNPVLHGKLLKNLLEVVVSYLGVITAEAGHLAA